MRYKEDDDDDLFYYDEFTNPNGSFLLHLQNWRYFWRYSSE